MKKKINGEIILIDDEVYEEEFLRDVLDRLNYSVKIKFFDNPKDGLHYITVTKERIFLIISDIHMPQMSGIELKETIEKNPAISLKAIPFVFASSMATKKNINAAYKHNIQGFFEKPSDFNKLTELFSTIIRYWLVNLTPGKTEEF
jgi:response regulator RpfG family c-di-GMP phosphodiesterase